MVKIKNVSDYLEKFAPLSYQEKYDNAGLILGDPNQEVKGILICLDTTENVIEEAIDLNCNLVVSHHPIIFSGLKKLTGNTYVERTVIEAIKNGIAIYAIHTNLDNVSGGVNSKICEKLELTETKVLLPVSGTLSKLVTFVPGEDKDKVLQALYEAGAGQIGDYDHCSFTVEGHGSFRPGDQADPHIGSSGKDERVEESRIELIFPSHKWTSVKNALDRAHPYEEVAHYLTALDNENKEIGAGMTGKLSQSMKARDFLEYLKEKMDIPVIRHTHLPEDKNIRKVAVCGGSGSFLIPHAKASGADVLVTADMKYHQFFDAEDKIIIADIGHYESEIFTKELLQGLLTKKFNSFALHLSKADKNPVSYF